ncbi:T9SS type A sorting domain-containing protein [Arcticibacterium luteifluviistationis]|uniref:Fibronectin type-III domain-containing protein n=1 Tax=Arcticibacterium luteifluviistationis TaxID=1784714 RepID=A0A2Z4GAJ3_9BACT|nr:T9SS type A sorting domain-containing protein [Arcticibacterium luteifluviistationis]AWV98095.1 hypothetical protein DJ013_07875 [Arcticibacterium luteifluviistationis]
MKNYTYVLAKKMILAFLVVFAWSGSSLMAVAQAPSVPPTGVHFDLSGNGLDGKVLWTMSPVTGSNEFIVEQSTDNGATWGVIGGAVPYTGAEDYQLAITGLTNGTTYIWRVKIQSDDGGLTLSSPVSTDNTAFTYNSITGSATVTELNKTSTAITINLVDGVTGEAGYKLYVKKSGAATYGAPYKTFTMSSSEQAVTIFGLDPNTFYNIYAQAYQGTSGKVSNTISVKTNRALPPKPATLTYRDLCPEKVTIDFTFDDISQFDELELKMNGAVVRVGQADTKSFTMTGLNPGTDYNFVVLTRNETGIANSNTLSVRTPAYLAPDGPSNITDPYDITTNSMTISWTNGQEDLVCLNKIRNEINFFVHIVNRDGTEEDRTYFTFPGETSFTIPDLQMKATVTTTLSSYNTTHNLRGFGERQVTGVTLGPPITPVDLGATPQTNHLGDEEILVTWNEYADDEDGSIVELKVGDGDYKVIGTIKANIAIFTYKPVQEGVTYTFRVKAFNQYGDSNYSEEATATPDYSTEPNAPYNLNAMLNGTTAVLTWLDDANNESGFEVQKSSDAGVTWEKIGEVGRNVNTFSDDAIVSGTTYWYGVKSMNSVGSSDLVTTKFTFGDAGTVGVINVYPNPTVDFLNLRMDNTKAATVSVINQSNRRVLSKTVDFENGEVSLDVSNFTPGAYQVVIIAGDKKVSRKIYKY